MSKVSPQATSQATPADNQELRFRTVRISVENIANVGGKVEVVNVRTGERSTVPTLCHCVDITLPTLQINVDELSGSLTDALGGTVAEILIEELFRQAQIQRLAAFFK